jgi:hypothetical protein
LYEIVADVYEVDETKLYRRINKKKTKKVPGA